MSSSFFSAEEIAEIQLKIGYAFKDNALLVQAFIHRSYANEHPLIQGHNERLEFLGDSILGMTIAEYLYRNLPHCPEGELSLFRSRLVDAASCCKYINKLDIAHFLLLGKGEKLNQGKGRHTILSDLFEALIGAISLDGGIEAARSFFLNNFQNEIDELIKAPTQNWKAILQDLCQKSFQKPPQYIDISQEGPDHSKEFTVKVVVNGLEFGVGQGFSKKEAQQAAAAAALIRMEKNN